MYRSDQSYRFHCTLCTYEYSYSYIVLCTVYTLLHFLVTILYIFICILIHVKCTFTRNLMFDSLHFLCCGLRCSSEKLDLPRIVQYMHVLYYQILCRKQLPRMSLEF